MSFGAPTPPDPTATAAAQTQYNTGAAQTQNKVNSYNQSNPFGSVNYVSDPNSPSGYSINTSLSAPNQGLLNTQFANQGLAGQGAQGNLGTANALQANTAGMYSQAPNIQALNPQGLVSQLNNWQQAYQQPIFQQQQSNLDAQLRNQGLQQGGGNNTAYNNAENLLARNQGDVQNQFMTNNIGQGLQAQQQNFGQQVTNYGLPLATESGLLSNASQQAGYASPNAPQFQQAPQAQIQPANYAGQVQQNYQQQNQNYENMLSGMFGIGTGVAGGWAKAGFPGASTALSALLL
jgi:hypothetical protein